ncbi:murein hydrolase activator EnvC family protein [Acuticoccus mangrovi]|uniref:Peptidoglycan DD-metalloendopeptidase family protein n=1 Tax=Acuticoccus mangrovi TaxID=2796142 RepID=A0A934IJR3_9HYPH|nr:peptidoglycan DD-metalloendopeptidase family protein [Acuticoccus mangrovi]MBJ3775037.1 peptidoglycan DD-metalloendopeptidase family protein [Acuticoccus mangrovi]
MALRSLLLAVTIFAAFAAGGSVRAQDAATEDTAAAVAREREQLLTRLERLREETSATQSRASELGEALVDLAGDEAKLRQQREDIAERVAALEQSISEEEEELEALTDGQARIRHQLAEKRTELATVLMALQRIGRRPPPALFGETGRPTDTVRGAILLNAVVPTLDDKAAALARTLTEAARLAAAERDRWTRLKADLETVDGERRRLEELGEELERRRALSLYERDRAAADLARLAEEEGSVSALLDRLSRSGAAPASPGDLGFAARRGSLVVPVAGRVVSRYGDLTETGNLSEGITIAALPQSTVFSPMTATVLFSAPFRGYGHVLILDAGDGYHMVLAGLDEASVAPGDEVSTGIPVGRMGRSSRRSAVAAAGVNGSALLGARPALYVELRKDGAAIDSHGWWRDAANDVGRTGG